MPLRSLRVMALIVVLSGVGRERQGGGRSLKTRSCSMRGFTVTPASSTGRLGSLRRARGREHGQMSVTEVARQD